MTKMAREILVTNDDGYDAKGINFLAEFLRRYGNVTVVAPKEPQSGKAASITMDRPLEISFYRKTGEEGALGSLRFYILTGTPVDCAKMGINIFIDEGRMPDLLVSGINHGSNASTAALYSGTLGAAKEGTVYGVPSIGFSIDAYDPKYGFSVFEEYAPKILDNYFRTGVTEGVYLNVNFPDIPCSEVKGVNIAHQGSGRWVKEFDHRISPRGKHYFWMVGEFQDCETAAQPKGDHRVMADGYVSVVPHKIDTTSYEEISRLKNIWQF